jgi:hypothetical protein
MKMSPAAARHYLAPRKRKVSFDIGFGEISPKLVELQANSNSPSPILLRVSSVFTTRTGEKYFSVGFLLVF